MENILNIISFLLIVLVLHSCSTSRVPVTPRNVASRTIVISGSKASEAQTGSFTTWICKDYVDRGSVLFEVGYFESSPSEDVGFILFDGGDVGERTNYQRTGLDRRWDWGEKGDINRYSFVIKPGGTGLYYDFNLVQDGEPAKPLDVYFCETSKKDR